MSCVTSRVYDVVKCLVFVGQEEGYERDIVGRPVMYILYGAPLRWCWRKVVRARFRGALREVKSLGANSKLQDRSKPLVDSWEGVECDMQRRWYHGRDFGFWQHVCFGSYVCLGLTPLPPALKPRRSPQHGLTGGHAVAYKAPNSGSPELTVVGLASHPAVEVNGAVCLSL